MMSATSCGKVILDVGCLPGPGIDELEQRGASVYAMESDPPPEQLPFPESLFDEVFLDGIVQRSIKPGHVIFDSLRVLRPGGRLTIVEHGRDCEAAAIYARACGFCNVTVAPLVGGMLAMRAFKSFKKSEPFKKLSAELY